MIKITRRIFAGLLALSVLVGLSGTSGGTALSYLCRMDGQVRASCCCRGADDNKSDKDCATLDKVDRCCDVSVLHFEAAPSWLDGHKPIVSPTPQLAAVVPVCTVAVHREPRLVTPMAARAPPGLSSASILVRHCSFLL